MNCCIYNRRLVGTLVFSVLSLLGVAQRGNPDTKPSDAHEIRDRYALIVDTAFSIDDHPLVSMTRLDIPGIFITREQKIGRNITIEMSAGAGFGIGYSEALGIMYELGMSVSGATKVYVNRTRRLEKGKSLRLNAGNYVTLRVTYSNTLNDANNKDWTAISTEIYYGIQRAIGRRWQFSFYGGAAYSYYFNQPAEDNRVAIYPALGFHFSYILSRKSL